MNRNISRINYFSGFTLIELLVVVGIIAVLSTLVVSNLSSARSKGQDAATKEQMVHMRLQASLYYEDHNGYSTEYAPGGNIEELCPTGLSGNNVYEQKNMLNSLKALKNSSGEDPKCYLSGGASDSNSQNWAVMAKLRSSKGYWCMDSGGNSRMVAPDFKPDQSAYSCNE